jgi:hypothetical protein
MPGNAYIPFQYIALALASLRMGTKAITRAARSGATGRQSGGAEFVQFGVKV